MNTHMYVLYVNWKYIYVKSEFLSQLSFIHLFISQYYWLPASCQALFQVLQLQGIKRSLHSTGVYIVWWGETDSNRAKIKDLVYQLLRNAMKENNAGIGERVPKDGGGDVCPDKRHYQRKLHWQGDILADTWNILIEKPRGSLGGSAWWVKETASAKALWQGLCVVSPRHRKEVFLWIMQLGRRLALGWKNTMYTDKRGDLPLVYSICQLLRWKYSCRGWVHLWPNCWMMSWEDKCSVHPSIVFLTCR